MYKTFIGGINADSLDAPNSSLTFSSRLMEKGFNLVSDPVDAEFAICVDNAQSFLRVTKKAGLHKNRLILVKNEPIVVCPQNSTARTKDRYGLILDMGRPPSCANCSIPWPQHWPKTPIKFKSPSLRKKKIVLINANKISFIPGELYSLRRKTLGKLKSLEFYGTSWDNSFNTRIRHAFSNLVIAIKGGYLPRVFAQTNYFNNYKNWLGAPLDKVNAMSNYNYCLVIENSTEFMTEKLFDAFFAGCIPIYVGPDLKEFPIPPTLYFQAEPSLKSITQTLSKAVRIEYNVWLNELNSWLQLDSTKNYWSAESVNNKVIETIIDYCEKVLLNVKKEQG